MTKLSYEQLVNLQLLLSVDRIGPVKIKNLLNKFKSFENVLRADLHSIASVDGIGTLLASKIIQAKNKKDEIEKEYYKRLQLLEKLGGQVVTIWDSDYPSILKRIYDPPILLYIKGNFEEVDQYSIAVVGTRTPTNYGKMQAERLTAELVEQRITIVSGLARGIDSVAHSSALKNDRRTIAVLGNGLDVVYPPENRKLRDEIFEKGLVISENEIGTKPDAQNFPRRNRIISGLSLGTVVIESGDSGGAMQTAAFALDQNREVFCVPGNLGIKQSEGTNLLIQKGEAKLIRNAEDIFAELNLKLKPFDGENIKKVPTDLNLFEAKIFEAVTNEPAHIDMISQVTALSTSDCLVHLLSLEFRGLIKQLPGKMFIKA